MYMLNDFLYFFAVVKYEIILRISSIIMPTQSRNILSYQHRLTSQLTNDDDKKINLQPLSHPFNQLLGFEVETLLKWQNVIKN